MVQEKKNRNLTKPAAQLINSSPNVGFFLVTLEFFNVVGDSHCAAMQCFFFFTLDCRKERNSRLSIFREILENIYFFIFCCSDASKAALQENVSKLAGVYFDFLYFGALTLFIIDELTHNSLTHTHTRQWETQSK